MKKYSMGFLYFLTCILMMLSLFVFTTNANAYMKDNHTMQSDEGTNTKKSTMAMDQSKHESKMLSWLSTLDKNEIAAGRLAISKNTSGEVRDYAKLMIQAHTKNLQETKNLMRKLHLQMYSSEPVKALKAEGKKELAMLRKKQGKDFDIAYINAMVKGHQDALKKLNDYIAQLGNGDEVKAHLETTMKHVEHHLEKAKSIQSNLS